MLDQATTKERRTYITPTNSEDMNPTHTKRKVTVIVEETRDHDDIQDADSATRTVITEETSHPMAESETRPETVAEHAERLVSQSSPARG